MERFPTVVIAEDDDDDYALLCRAWGADPRIVFRRVADGRALIDLVCGRECAAACPGRDPLLIILDLSMPRMNGFEALGELRAQPHLRGAVVIVMSGTSSQAEVDRAYSLGCNAFIRKPSSLAELVDAIEGVKRFWLRLATLPSLAAPSGALGGL